MSRIMTVERCDSTNKYLHGLLSSDPGLPGGFAVRAVEQTAGRGQRGNTWEAEPGKNLTFSMVLRPGHLEAGSHFYLSEAVAVGVARFLLSIPEMAGSHDVRIKWPNDILVDGGKISGILIENSLSANGEILHSIVGIGLNVNQRLFSEGAPMATSVGRLLGRDFELAPMLEDLVGMINGTVERVASADSDGTVRSLKSLEADYHGLLWRDGKRMDRWLDAQSEEVFEARLTGVRPSGHLCLRLAGGEERRYLFKEVFPV